MNRHSSVYSRPRHLKSVWRRIFVRTPRIGPTFFPAEPKMDGGVGVSEPPAPPPRNAGGVGVTSPPKPGCEPNPSVGVRWPGVVETPGGGAIPIGEASGVPAKMGSQPSQLHIGSFQSCLMDFGFILMSSSSWFGNRPSRFWKARTARAYCFPRKISSCSRSRSTIVATVGPTAASRIVRTAIRTTTPTRVKPGERRPFTVGASPFAIEGSVQRLVLGVAVDVDDAGRSWLAIRIIRLVGIRLLHREHPVGRLGHRVERDLAHVAVLDEDLQVGRVVALVALVLVDHAAEREEVGAQRSLA